MSDAASELPSPTISREDLLHLWQRGEPGEALDAAIEEFCRDSRVTGGELRDGVLAVCQAREDQFMAAPSEEERGRRRTAWQAALRRADALEKTREAECIVLVVKAALAREEGRSKQAANLLGRAESLAQELGHPLLVWAVKRGRARWARKNGDVVLAELEARRALSIAQDEEWSASERQLKEEFELQLKGEFALDGLPRGSVSSAHSSHSSKSSQSSSSGTTIEYRDALLQIALASAVSLDQKQVVDSALEAIIAVTGADRAALLLNADSGALAVEAVLDRSGAKSSELKGFSSSVARRAHDENRVILVTGTEEAAALGSESAVAHGLRSIMAAPLAVEGRPFGVLYIDSVIARRLFGEQEREFIAAIAAQVALAINTLKASSDRAQVAAERARAEKELELTSTVQSLFLPKEPRITRGGVQLRGYYRPAQQCGGDWWWYDDRPDVLRVWVGDVTGHGVASAMVTAVIAGLHLGVPALLDDDIPIPDAMALLSDELWAVTGGSFRMTLSAVEVRRERENTLTWYNAGAPPIFHIQQGKITSVASLGLALGSTQRAQPSEFGVKELKLGPSDRVAVFTDGLYEFSTPNGRVFGMRKLKALLQKAQGLELDRFVESISQDVDEARGDVPLDDDVTFAVLERTP